MNQQERDAISLVARTEASDEIMRHIGLCPFSSLKIEERLRGVEGRFLALIGFMVGSGLIGGVSGAALAKILEH
jgi:hypothetical protein